MEETVIISEAGLEEARRPRTSLLESTRLLDEEGTARVEKEEQVKSGARAEIGQYAQDSPGSFLSQRTQKKRYKASLAEVQPITQAWMEEQSHVVEQAEETEDQIESGGHSNFDAMTMHARGARGVGKDDGLD